MNQVLGGGPQSRLFLDLREEHSYTYGAYSRVSAEVYPGDWDANAAVRTPVTDGSMERFVYEFKRIRDEPVPASELDDARRAIVAGFALSLERPAELLNNILQVQHFRPARRLLGQVSRPHRRRGRRRRCKPPRKNTSILAHMQWVGVGDRKQIRDALAKYGPVTVISAEGKTEN